MLRGYFVVEAILSRGYFVLVAILYEAILSEAILYEAILSEAILYKIHAKSFQLNPELLGAILFKLPQ